MGTLSIDQILSIRSVGGTEALHWSPHGYSVRFVSSLSGQPEIWSVAVDDPAPVRLTTGMGGVGFLASFVPKRSPVDDVIAYVSGKSGAEEVWIWRGDGSEDLQLTRFGGRVEALNWSPDGARLGVAANASGTFNIYTVDVSTGAMAQLTGDDRYEVNPTFTPDGERILYVRLNEDWTDHDVILINADGSDPRVVLHDTGFFDYGHGRTFGYPIVSPDGEYFLFRSHRSNWINIWLAKVDGSGELRQIAAAAADQSDAVWSPDGRQVAFIENHNGTLELNIVEVESGEVQSLVTPEMGVCTRPAWSSDGSQIAYLFGSPTTPNDVWVVDVASGERRQLTRSLPGGVEERLVMPEKTVYESWDGLPISAYVYCLPAQEVGLKYPGLMWIHGGPTSQFLDSFQPQVQYFVQQGYVVMLPNVRGSSGYGLEFEDLNNGDWGHGDLRDVIEGVRYLKSLPEIDPEHTGITGTSYGGIMSMAATVWTEPGVFQAAVPCSGYGDFVYMVGEEEIRHNKLMEYEFGKLPDAEDVYYRCSPIYWSQQASVPCFIVHGEGRYPGSTSSIDFAMALEAAYKPFWYKTYPGENYYIYGRGNVRQLLLDMKMFLDFYLKGIPYDLPTDGSAPLTRVNGVIPYRSWLSTVPFVPEKNGPRYGFDQG